MNVIPNVLIAVVVLVSVVFGVRFLTLLSFMVLFGVLLLAKVGMLSFDQLEENSLAIQCRKQLIHKLVVTSTVGNDKLSLAESELIPGGCLIRVWVLQRVIDDRGDLNPLAAKNLDYRCPDIGRCRDLYSSGVTLASEGWRRLGRGVALGVTCGGEVDEDCVETGGNKSDGEGRANNFYPRTHD